MIKKKTVKQQTVSLKKKTAKKKGWVAPGVIKKPGQKIPAGRLAEILRGMDKKKGKKK